MRLLDYDGLKAKGFDYSRTHFWRLIKAGRFPKPIKLGDGARNAWVEEEIDQLIADRMAARESQVGLAPNNQTAPAGKRKPGTRVNVTGQGKIEHERGSGSICN